MVRLYQISDIMSLYVLLSSSISLISTEYATCFVPLEAYENRFLLKVLIPSSSPTDVSSGLASSRDVEKQGYLERLPSWQLVKRINTARYVTMLSVISLKSQGKMESSIKTSSFRLIGIVNGEKLDMEDGVTKLLGSYILGCG